MTEINHLDASFDLNGAIPDRFLDLGKLHRFMPVIIFLPGRSDTNNDKNVVRGFANT